MQIRPITADEIAAFAAITSNPENSQSIHHYLEGMFDRAAMRLDWCFVVEEDGRFLGRLAYWSSPKVGVPSDIVLFDVPWEQDHSEMGTELLLQTRPTMRTLGTTVLGHVLDSPPQSPQWQDFPEQRHQLLDSLGFQIVRETDRFSHDQAPRRDPVGERLTFRSLPEVGTEAFLSAIEQVSAGTLDQLIQKQRTGLGAAGAAHEMLSILHEMAYDPTWWQLAFTAGGVLVGLIMPTNSLTAGTIGYIGVVPTQRGHGYGYELLVHGTEMLHAEGINTIRADADVGNVPMAKAFARAGYSKIGMRRTYQLNNMA